MWEVILIIFLPTIAPGLALIRILDASADTFRKTLLCFPIGLLTLFGISGLLFVVELWSILSLTLVLLLTNILSIVFLLRKVQIEQTTYTQWQKMEAAIHGVVLSESEPEIEHEVATQHWFQSNRNPVLQIIAGCFCLLTLVPILMFDRPFGVDWIGFSTLASNVGQTGTFEVQSPNKGLWTYPPAFPTVLAWVSTMTGTPVQQAILVLGHLSLFALLLGGEEWTVWEREHRACFAMGASFALFQKSLILDTQLLQASWDWSLVAYRSTSNSTIATVPHYCFYFPRNMCCAHPSYGCDLSRCPPLRKFGYSGTSSLEGEKAQRKPIFFTSLVIISSMFFIALIFFAPRMLSEPVFAEYGWQGGKPMLMFNGPLMLFAGISVYLGRASLEIQLLSIWFASLWLLSFVHLIEGLADIQVLSLLSYTLYSMALHAYHIPLAVIVGLLASRSTSFTTVDDSSTWFGLEMDSFIRPMYSTVFLVALMIGSILSVGLLTNLSSHDELHATTSGMLNCVNIWPRTPRTELFTLKTCIGAIATHLMHQFKQPVSLPWAC